jgi:hypothetical protein
MLFGVVHGGCRSACCWFGDVSIRLAEGRASSKSAGCSRLRVVVTEGCWMSSCCLCRFAGCSGGGNDDEARFRGRCCWCV